MLSKNTLVSISRSLIVFGLLTFTAAPGAYAVNKTSVAVSKASIASSPVVVYKSQIGKAMGEGISIRKGPGVQYGWQAGFHLGVTFKILGTSGSFYKVSYNGVTGYVSKQYVKIMAAGTPITVKPAAPAAPTTPALVYKNQTGIAASEGISIRTGAGTPYNKQGTFKLGETINILGTSGSWYKVSYSGVTGYVSNQDVIIIDSDVSDIAAAKLAVANLETQTAKDLTVEANLIGAEAAVTSANTAVKAVDIAAETAILQTKITAAETKVIAARTAFEAKVEAAAETAVAKAETSKLTADITAATAAVVAVKDTVKAAAFTARISAINSLAVVSTVSAINATQVNITFSKAIDPASLFTDGVSGTFKATLTLTSLDSVNAGTLAGTLSTDGKTLTVTAGNALSKRYDVVVDNLLAKDGTSLVKYSDLVTIAADKTAPTIISTTKTSAGTFKVTFSEPLSAVGTISYKLADGTVINNGGNGVTNTLSADRKEITFVVGNDVAANKQVIATFIGTQDQAGNLLTPNPSIASFVKGDKDGIAPTVASITQTGALTFSVKFSEQVSSKPVVKIGGVAVATANIVQDATDLTMYKVTVPSALDGVTNVAVETFVDLSGENGTDINKVVTFVKDIVAPKVVSSVVSVNTTDTKEYLVVTFDKDVTLANPTIDATSGSYVKDFVTTTLADLDIAPQTATYKDATNKKVIQVPLATLLTNKDVKGAVYTLNLAFAGITNGASVAASTASTTFTRSEDGIAANANVLGAPTVSADVNNNNKVKVTFTGAVDGASASNAANYTVDGAIIESVSLQPLSGGTQIAVLNLKAGSNGFTGIRNISVANVKALGSSKVMVPYSVNTVSLNENVAPVVTSAKLTATNKITLTFSEAITDSVANDFEVLFGGVSLATPETVSVGAVATTTKTITIPDVTAAQLSAGISLKGLTTLDVVDAAGNKLTVPTNIIVTQ